MHAHRVGGIIVSQSGKTAVRWVAAVLGMVALWSAVPAGADSWMPPKREVYEAAGKNVRFTVIPRVIADPADYFAGKVDLLTPAGQQADGAPRARGILERRRGSGWVTIWDKPLVNDMAPVTALVADDGAHVVTFDNWHSLGFGEHVVVIYRGDGSVVRSFELTDILPEDYVRALPRTASSLHWGGEHALSADGRTLILKVGVRRAAHPSGFVDVTIDLPSGTVAPLTGRGGRGR